MKKRITFVLVLTALATIAFSQVTITPVWEFSVAKSNVPAYIGSGNKCRGMAVGTFGGENVVAVPTREGDGGANVVVLNAADGQEKYRLKMDGVTGGTFPVNDAAITADGKIMACNLVTAAGAVFKVYQWDTKDAAPTVALAYTMEKAERFGDLFTVTGSLTDGTAKIYAVSAKKVDGVARIICFSMRKKDDGVTWEFNPLPTNYNQSTTANYASVAILPSGNGLYSVPGQSLTELNAAADFAPITQNVLPSAAMSTYTISGAYITTKGTDMYVGALGYSSDLHCGVVAKIPANDWSNATLAGKTPAFHNAESNPGGTGRFRAQEEGGKIFLYVLETNNGIGKYEMTITETSLADVSYNLSIESGADRLTVKGLEASSIELFNLVGQRVRLAHQSNEITTQGLSGAYLVRIHADGRPVKTEKVIIR